ncbi:MULTISPECIES: MucBP domain-containing protein [unclassified Enterococcus]|uniref:MucBP domain-containing protein n=1 Tax=unclassified Enterococcus TaxID=2608891 RepID=UPI0013EDF6A9|nr:MULTISPECIES: MucBP domain-containing protein [unclassified Enterococcus]
MRTIYRSIRFTVLITSVLLLSTITVTAQEQTNECNDPSMSLNEGENEKGTQETAITAKTIEESQVSEIAESENSYLTNEQHTASSEELSSWLPDPVLQKAVAASLNTEIAALTKEKMSDLTTLYIYETEADLTDLSGLEYAVNLSSFYMRGTNQVTDFSVLVTLPKLTYVYLMGANVTDENLPLFGTNITRLNLSSANVTDKVYDKIVHLQQLESLSFESNFNITTISPLAVLPKLEELRIQFCGVTDFTVIDHFPALRNLAAFGQNTGRNDPPTTLHESKLNYDAEQQTIYLPFSIMPNRLVNFDGYMPPFTTSNSPSQTYLDINGTQITGDRLMITEQGITVSGITPENFEAIQTIEYNARLNNPMESYNKPAGYSFYAISSGTYLHQFQIAHLQKAGEVTVEYLDQEGQELRPPKIIEGNIGESYDATTEDYKLTIDGYTLDETQLPKNAIGLLDETPQTVSYVYTKETEKTVAEAKVIVQYQDEQNRKLADDVVLVGRVGDEYRTEERKIDGYVLKEIKGKTVGDFTEQKQVIIYIYVSKKTDNGEKKEGTSQNADKETNKDDGGSVQDKINNNIEEKKTEWRNVKNRTRNGQDTKPVQEKRQEQLPETSENKRTSQLLSLVGILAILGLIFTRNKQKQK